MPLNKLIRFFALLLAALLLAAGCAARGAREEPAPFADGEKAREGQPKVPEQLRMNEDGVPVIRVYLTDEEESRSLDAETYLLGVVAGEMKNDWPLEALKAQAILARTFLMKFCAEKKSKYPDADISTDIEEAQAYDFTAVNDRVEQAVRETRGQVLVSGGAFPYAWFHAHSGGLTARAKEGLGYDRAEPGYTHSVPGMDSEDAPAAAQAWEASFSAEQVLAAAEKAGAAVTGPLKTVAVGERGESGRAVTLLLNGQSVSAPELRVALGSTAMRSTLLTGLRMQDGRVLMAGKGYGHGVGMPQWGAYALAESGKGAEEIVTYYFQNVTVEKLW